MKKLTAIVVIVYFIPLLIWWLVLGVYSGGSISLNNSDWGAFGSFVGGVLSPLFSLVSIIFLYLSIRKNNENHQDQLDLLKAHNRREQLVKLIDIYNSKLDEPVGRQFDSILCKSKSSGCKVNVYTDGSKYIDFPGGAMRDVIFGFYSSKSAKKRHSEEYIDLVKSIVANVELCFCKVLELLSSIENPQEFEDAVDIAEALSEFHTTIGLLEFNLSQLLYSDDSPLLERLALLNKRTKFKNEAVVRYLRIKEIKAAG